MSYFNYEELNSMGFKSLGKGVKISKKASIYNHNLINLGDFCRVDDFCVISGNVSFGKYVHVTPMCLLAGGVPGLILKDFSTFAYGVKIFTQSDDYSGLTMCNSMIPKKFKKEIFQAVTIGRQVIVGAGSTIMPGAHVGDGCAIGAMSLVLNEIEPWGIYAGVPVKRLKDRSRALLNLEAEFLKDEKNDTF